MKNFSGFDKNAKSAGPFVLGIGKYLINFGAVEFMTYQYIQILSHDEIVYDLSKNMPLSKRLDLIKKLAQKRNLSGDLLADINKITTVAKELSIFRNNIAHNPILIGSTKNQGKESVAFVGVPNWKKANDMSSVPMISAESIRLGVDALVELAENMDEILSKLKNVLNT